MLDVERRKYKVWTLNLCAHNKSRLLSYLGIVLIYDGALQILEGILQEMAKGSR